MRNLTFWLVVGVAAPTFAATPDPSASSQPSGTVDGQNPASPTSEDVYALDTVSREVSPKGKVECPKVPMVLYRGDTLRYHKPVNIYVGFREHLRQMETIVRDTAIEVYGRQPVRIRHMGTYNCRRIRGWPTYISEHALGNGIDIEGFDFAPARKRESQNLPVALRRGFQVRVLKHWNSQKNSDKLHDQFLHLLIERITHHEHLFRTMLGPAYPGHHNHFHFDCGPWPMIVI